MGSYLIGAHHLQVPIAIAAVEVLYRAAASPVPIGAHHHHPVVWHFAGQSANLLHSPGNSVPAD